MKASDLSELDILRFLAAQHHASTQWKPLPSGMRSMPSVATAVPPEVPEKVLRAKLRAMNKKGLVHGCGCGCRGDWYISETGREFLAELTHQPKL